MHIFSGSHEEGPSFFEDILRGAPDCIHPWILSVKVSLRSSARFAARNQNNNRGGRRGTLRKKEGDLYGHAKTFVGPFSEPGSVARKG